MLRPVSSGRFGECRRAALSRLERPFRAANLLPHIYFCAPSPAMDSHKAVYGAFDRIERLDQLVLVYPGLVFESILGLLNFISDAIELLPHGLDAKCLQWIDVSIP